MPTARVFLIFDSSLAEENKREGRHDWDAPDTAGRNIAVVIREALVARGFECQDPYEEDFGWEMEALVKGVRTWCAVSNRTVIVLNVRLSFLDWLRRHRRNQVKEEIAGLFMAILSSDARFCNVRRIEASSASEADYKRDRG